MFIFIFFSQINCIFKSVNLPVDMLIRNRVEFSVCKKQSQAFFFSLLRSTFVVNVY